MGNTIADAEPTNVGVPCLLLMESGSVRPGWMDDFGGAAVVTQAPHEPASDFAERSIDAIRLLAGDLCHVVLAAGTASGEDVFSARCRIARAAAATVAAKAGSLLFSGRQRTSSKVRHELFAIAGVLIERIADSRMGVAVRFDG